MCNRHFAELFEFIISDLVKNHREKNNKVDINSSIFHVTGKNNLQFQHTGSLLVFKADCVL